MRSSSIPLALLFAAALLSALVGCRPTEPEPFSPAAPCGQEYAPGEEGGCEVPASVHEVAWRYGRGSICTHECADELDCPSLGSRRARCVKVSPASPFLCYLDCGDAEGCPSGWVCQPIQGGGRICLP